jgi:peptide/nickel transport system permease protein
VTDAAVTAPKSAVRRWRALLATREARLAAPFALILLALFLMAALAPWIAPLDPNKQSLLARLKPPGFVAGGVTYWFGTDELGRDLLSRVIYGARISLLVALLSIVVSGGVGTTLGLIAGNARGWVETVILRAVDIMLSIPAILLVIITVAVLGPGLVNLVLVLGLTRWPRYTRIAYGQTLAVSSLSFVTAARLSGASEARVIFRHLLPNIIGPIIVVATLEFGLLILFEGGVSYLGLGIQPPTPSWGAIMSVGRNYVSTAWWITVFPGSFLFLTVLSVNLFGDFLRDRFDRRAGA